MLLRSCSNAEKNRTAGRWHCNQNNCPNEGRLNFLYKWVSEDMGPADTYCPDNILDELSEADSDWAKNWRAECRKCNERKQKLSAMPVGSEIKVTCNGFEYIMTKTVLPSHSTPQWINFEENFKFTVDDMYN